MGRVAGDRDRFRSPVAELAFPFGIARLRQMLGCNPRRRLFGIEAELFRPEAELASRDGALAADDLRERGMVSGEKACEGPQRVARIGFAALFEFAGQAIAELLHSVIVSAGSQGVQGPG